MISELDITKNHPKRVYSSPKNDYFDTITLSKFLSKNANTKIWTLIQILILSVSKHFEKYSWALMRRTSNWVNTSKNMSLQSNTESFPVLYFEHLRRPVSASSILNEQRYMVDVRAVQLSPLSSCWEAKSVQRRDARDRRVCRRISKLRSSRARKHVCHMFDSYSTRPLLESNKNQIYSYIFPEKIHYSRRESRDYRSPTTNKNDLLE